MSKKTPFSPRLQKKTLAEQVASTLEEAILEGRWRAGEALPTEPELANSFEVSRAVIRDATRMLAARGLVEAQHGRGVFVTESQSEAFGYALLLALRRSEASVWDVEQFEQMVFPQVCALAAASATPSDRQKITALGQKYIEIYSETLKVNWQNSDSGDVWNLSREAFLAFLHAIYDATNNKVWQLLAGPILRLRSLRKWDDSDIQLEVPIDIESNFINRIIDIFLEDEPQNVQQKISQLMGLPLEAQEAMKMTAVGKIPTISISPMRYSAKNNV